MGRNEIRLRRQRMSAGRIAQHRNYSVLMQQHEKDLKIKRIVRVVIYFLIILFIVIVLTIVVRWQDRNTKQKKQQTSEIVMHQQSP